MSAQDHLSEVQFPGSLRKHIQELHSRISPVPRSNEDLVKAHGRDHHHSYGNHFHVEDNAGNLAGPNTDQRRPSGWVTGDHAVMREKR